ncbi:MAG: arginine--tRNA ligase [Eubacteriales bacterium]|nr:arginine--tRNA ligase [Eubacteriales bacterium]
MKDLDGLIRQQIKEVIRMALAKAEITFEDEINIESPRDVKFGDFSANTAMLLAKQEKLAPRMIAQKIIDNMSLEDTYIDRIEIAGAGFINFYLKDGWQTGVLPIIEEMCDNYGYTDFGNGEKVMIEFVSANPTGPMHMGNARGGALGDSLGNVMKMAGFDVTKEFYLNDAGNQIEKFAKSLEARYLQQYDPEYPFPEDGYHGDDIKERAAQFTEINGDKYVQASSQDRRNALTEFSLEKNIAAMKETLNSYRVVHDIWYLESDLYKSGDVEKTIKALMDSGEAYEQDGTVWLKGEEKDEVLVRNNGIPTYFAADIAYHYNKFVTRGFDRVINIWGADHHGHIARMKNAMALIGINPDRLQVVTMQLVRLMRGGEVARQSKRTGGAITLTELIEDIGIDASRYFFNMRNAGSHFDFDLDLAVQQSNDNPVYYVQYAHARICSIIRQMAEEGVAVPSCKDVNLTLLDKPEEVELLRKLAQFPGEIKLSAEVLEPAKITKYVSELAGLFHSFYNAHRVKGEDKSLMNARLKLVDSVRITLKNALGILAVDAPEKM